MHRARASLAFLSFLLGVCSTAAATAQTPATTEFTYQGVVSTEGMPLNGTADLRFSLWDAPTDGTQIGATVERLGETIVGGLVDVELDFGGAFRGEGRWLEIEIRSPAGGGAYVTLAPRQPLLATPYALGLVVPTGATGLYDGPLLEISNGATGPVTPAVGIKAIATALTSEGASRSYGVWGESASRFGVGVIGVANTDETGGEDAFGVWGLCHTNSGTAVYGYAPAGGTTKGVHGKVDSTTGHAGYFEGRSYFSGRTGFGTTNPLAPVHVQPATSAEQFLVHAVGSHPQGTWLNLDNVTTGGRMWSLISTGSQNGEGTGAFLIRDSDAQLVRLMIRPDGLTGINTTFPDYMLEVNGTAGKPGGGSWSNSSDLRLKKNVRDLEGALDSLLSLRGVSFEYKDPDAIHELPGVRIGMIAQEVEPVFPDWVDVGPRGHKRVTYRGFEALTVEALRELRAEKDEEIRALRAENDALRARLDALERAIAPTANEGER